MLAPQVVLWETRNMEANLIQPEQVEQVILLIRGQSVMLDRDLAALYGVETKNLNKAVRRNLDRFPADFMFQLTLDEAQACAASRFQFGTLKRGQNIKYLPQVFTQEGVAMLSSVLRSPPRHPGQHSDHAGVRAPARDARLAHGTCSQAGRTGAQD